MTRDEAVRVVAEALLVAPVGQWLVLPGPVSLHNQAAEAAVSALVAAGWGDLATERERLAAEAPVVTQYTAAGVALAAASGTDVAWICVDDVRDAFTALAADRDALRARLTAERERLAAEEATCTCGYGGFHEPENPRCGRNAARLIRDTPQETP